MSFDHKQKLVELAEGVYVENDVLNIVEKIRAYDPNLRVKYADPARAELTDAPYRITELCPDGIERVVFSVWVLDESVLQRLYAADTRKLDVLSSVVKQNEKAAKEQKRRYREEMDQADDYVVSALRSPKGRYTIRDGNKLIKIDDDPMRKHSVETKE